MGVKLFSFRLLAKDNYTWDFKVAKRNTGGVVALSAGPRTCDLSVAGSSPTSAPLRSGLRQATYT